MSKWYKRLARSLEKTGLGALGADPGTVKKIVGPSNPASRGEMDAINGAAMTRDQEQGALNDLQQALPNIPQTLRQGYTSDAQRAGTYADTPAFRQGLDSEVQAGSRGARVDNIARQNALLGKLGQPLLPPEQSGDLSTDANQTAIQSQNAKSAADATSLANTSGGMPANNAVTTNPLTMAADPATSQNAVVQRQSAIGNRLGNKGGVPQIGGQNGRTGALKRRNPVF